MRVLIVHNRYRSGIPSGENRVVDLEIEALRALGHEVETYIRSSDEIASYTTLQRAAHLGSPVASPSAQRDVERVLVTKRPDVMHLHNPYPLISMSAVAAAYSAGVPVVQTVHNHRHTCMKGTYQRGGHLCQDCLHAGHPGPGVRHACYRDSRAQSVVMAAALLRYRRERERIARFIALTPEIEASLLESGIERSRVVVKPNAVPDHGEPTPLGTGAAFVGRLSAEKGVLALVEAWSMLPRHDTRLLRIAGDGPDAAQARQLAQGRDDIVFLGQVAPEAVVDLLVQSALLVVPSLWPEALPLVVLEALSAGRPLLVTDQGGLPSAVGDQAGVVVAPDVPSLAQGLRGLLGDRAALMVRGAAARARYLERFHPQPVTQALVDIYDSAIRAAR